MEVALANSSRNLFEIDNARNMSPREVVDTFLPTRSFWRLLSTKNHIVCGARGSGKTVLMKMLGHDHLSSLNNSRAKKIIEDRSFIGIYVPTKIEWVSALKNKQWESSGDAELFFQWRLNVACCMRFLVTLASCLRAYVPDDIQRARREIAIARLISAAWSDGARPVDTFGAIAAYLAEIEFKMQTQLARKRVMGTLRANEEYAGLVFFSELFVPLRRAMAIAMNELGLPNSTNWLLCLDEAEFLDESQQQILNSHLRAESGNLFFKISTMPYHHKTIATNTGASLSVGHDFEYVYIDRDLIRISPYGDDAGERAALDILDRRASLYASRIDRDAWGNILGPSPLLESTPSEWRQPTQTMRLIEKFGDEELIARARKLSGSKGFRDQIARKIKSALVLREAVAAAKGNSTVDVYSGLRLAIRCSDANPRRLIRIFNSMVLRATRADGKVEKISASNQSAVLTQFAESSLNRTLSYPRVGRRVFEIISAIGTYARDQLHGVRLSSDQVSGIKIDRSVSRDDWEAITAAVGLGLLFPQTTPSKGDPMPEHEGTFHLAYVLAPLFRILPRRGKPRKASMVKDYASHANLTAQLQRARSLPLDFGEP